MRTSLIRSCQTTCACPWQEQLSEHASPMLGGNLASSDRIRACRNVSPQHWSRATATITELHVLSENFRRGWSAFSLVAGVCEGLGPSPRLLGYTFPADVKLMPFQSHFNHGALHPHVPSRSETLSLTDVAPESFRDSGIYGDMRGRGCACLGRCNQPGRVRR